MTINIFSVLVAVFTTKTTALITAPKSVIHACLVTVMSRDFCPICGWFSYEKMMNFRLVTLWSCDSQLVQIAIFHKSQITNLGGSIQQFLPCGKPT